MNQKPNYGNWVPENSCTDLRRRRLFLVLARCQVLLSQTRPSRSSAPFSAPFCSPSASICMRATNALPLEKAI